MKKIVSPLVGILMFGLSGCIKPGNNVECLDLMPAIAGFSFDAFQPTLTIQGLNYIAPDLMSDFFTVVNEGDVLIVSFCIDYSQQPYECCYMVSDLIYDKIDKEWPSSTTGGESVTGDFNLPIESITLYGLEQNIMFFIFSHRAPRDQKISYEMTYDRDKTENPVLYIRAKKIGDSSSSETDIRNICAFDMYSFFSYFKDSSNKVSFEIQFKTGVDEDGKDKYERYSHPSMGYIIEIPFE